ncbi:hypothetical protein FisN_27Lu112 [Fistulifera solaris]|uniref:Uncharacterized protein n=1 Tax=Fistulifera solaris TaxID=1519565 RepID=A0A1Z5JR92_FISSO|nr:hypothetical protein FisN_27Lu112 [Fistulifera solaris]|eukprot:GAX16362.1 hypothetical protein FisN_27Lu112 [Fistulifera solaris]
MENRERAKKQELSLMGGPRNPYNFPRSAVCDRRLQGAFSSIERATCTVEDLFALPQALPPPRNRETTKNDVSSFGLVKFTCSRS